MATTISNPATFSSVRNAFSTEGYGTSTSFYAYRQGGGIVPSSSEFNVIGAGTSGDPLQLSQFNGFSVPSLITLTNDSVEWAPPLPVATVQWTTTFDGWVAYTNNNGDTVNQYRYCPSGVSTSLFQVRADVTAGFIDFSSPSPTGTWLSCSETRAWNLTSIGGGEPQDAELFVQIRRASDQVVLASCTVYLYSNATG